MSEFIDIDESRKDEFNSVVSHPMQTYEWGEFRKKTGIKVIRRGQVKDKKIIDGFTLTLHKVPKTKYFIGNLPRGNAPTAEILKELERIGMEENCIFIQLEPNVVNSEYPSFSLSLKERVGVRSKIITAAHPLFTKHTFVLDLTKSEPEILAAMHSKTRYNIRVAEKHKVKVEEDNSEKSFEEYYKLMTETTNRQGFYAHTPSYHKKLFEALPKKIGSNSLSYHLLNATYSPQEQTTNNQQLTLTAWVLFVFKDTLYYPYGASSREHRETMSNNLTAWEAIKFGKKLGLKKFDMWGSLGPEPDKNDPWYGFHHFKEGYGPELVEFVGSYDFIIKPALYELYKVADKLRWIVLKFKK